MFKKQGRNPLAGKTLDICGIAAKTQISNRSSNLAIKRSEFVNQPQS